MGVERESAEVAVLLPSYRTPELTKLCLRLLRRHAPPEPLRILVIDNGSEDRSLPWLRSLPWVELLERSPEPGETPSAAHAAALDLALERVREPFVLSIHTDTLVRRDGWLEPLLGPMRDDPQLDLVGSWKLEVQGPLKRVGQRLEGLLRGLRGRARKPRPERFARSHAALYRSAALRAEGLRFSTGGETAGRGIHEGLRAAGRRTLLLEPAELLPFMVHANHATMALNPELGARPRTVRKGLRRLRRLLRDLDAAAVLADDSLDR